MSTTFFKDTDNRQVYSRGYARGLKTFELGEGIVSGSNVEFNIQDGKLIATKSEDTSNAGDIAFIGRRFGLVGKEIGFTSKVDVLLLGDGLMLVTLIQGALVLDLDGKLSPVAVGSIPANLAVVENNIDWVTREHILQYIGYFDSQREYPYEFEFVFEFSGHADQGRTIRHIAEEDADISMGYIQEHQRELAARQHTAQLQAMLSKLTLASQMGFDEEEPDEDDDEEESYLLEDDEEYFGKPQKSTRKSKKKAEEEEFDDYFI